MITDYSGPGAEEFKTNTGFVLAMGTGIWRQSGAKARRSDEKADVYSLAVVMYRMCCGKCRFAPRVRAK